MKERFKLKASDVVVEKQSEILYFSAKSRKCRATVALSISWVTGRYTLNTPGREAVSFYGDSVEQSELRIVALAAAISYAKKHLKKQA